MIRIDGLAWDERSEEHIAIHGVTFDEVEQVVTNRLHVRRSGPYQLVIGQTNSGRYLTVILDYEGGGLWYPVTARPTSHAERRMVNNRRRR